MAELKICPYCAEEIKAEAKKCRYCGEWLDDDALAISSKADEYSQFPWLFVGAYAIYGGTAKVKRLGEVEATAKVEVAEIDLTNNRWKAALHSHVGKKVFGKSIKLSEQEMVEWLPIGELIIVSDNAKKIAEYEGIVRIDDLGVRECIIQEYEEGLNTELVFWEKKLRWPLKYVMIFRRKKEDPRKFSKEIGRAIQSFPLIGSSRTEIEELAWSIKDLTDELKKSKSPSLRELPLVLFLRETNIPGIIIS